MKNPLSKHSALESFLGEPTEGESRRPAAPTEKPKRITFAVSGETLRKYELLRQHAYIERKQIKDVFEEMLTEYLAAHFDPDRKE